jgi:hypothetical protein
MFTGAEPFYGWLHLYNHEMDERSPFHGVEHNLFYFDRFVHDIPAHPLWDSIESESLLVKILYADYAEGYAIVELFGEWNDLFENDFRLLYENCLCFLTGEGVDKFIFICENVFYIYLQEDDYYQAFIDDISDGWACLLRARPHVIEEVEKYGMGRFFYWSPALSNVEWRKLKPDMLCEYVEEQMRRTLAV